MMTAHVQSTQ